MRVTQLLVGSFVAALTMTTVSASAQSPEISQASVMTHFFPEGSNGANFVSNYSRHLRDESYGYIAPSLLNQPKFEVGRKLEIRGKAKHYDIAVLPYRYDVFREGSKNILEVRIYLKNGTDEEKSAFAVKVVEAADYWNTYRPSDMLPITFRFRVVNDPEIAHFQVKLVPGTRGPYLKALNPEFRSTTVAHEVGHMMGLVDEYQGVSLFKRKTLENVFHCDTSALMCMNNTYLPDGHPVPFYYYLIERRILMTTAAQKASRDEN